MNSLIALVATFVCGVGLGCGGNKAQPEDASNPPATTTTEGNAAPAARPKLSAEECNAKGTVVGDIGDGATQRDSYRCPNGKPPIGNVASGIEGSVCCAK